MNYWITSNIDDIDKKQWHEFIYSHPDQNVFQTYEMFNFLTKVNLYNPFVFCCFDEKKEITGILVGVMQNDYKGILCAFSARSIIWGGPLIKNNSKEVASLLLTEYEREYKSKVVFTEFRNLFDIASLKSIFINLGFSYNEHLNFQVSTLNKEETLKSISKSKLRQIKKGITLGASITEANNIEDVRHFYYILKNLYKNKVKKPLPSWSFFESFFYTLCIHGLGKYFLIKYNNKVIGGIMCVITDRKVIYEWYIAGDDMNYKHLYPSILSTYAAIKYGIDNQFAYFDFMGAGKPSEAYGVREFKSKFGGNLVNYGRYLRIEKPLLMLVSRTAYKFWKLIK